MPTGYPDLVEPSLDKVDLTHLRRDITKYKAAGVLDGADFEWWKHFLSSFEEEYGSIPDSPPDCPLDAIFTLLQDPPPPSEANVPKLITDLHSAQKKPSQEVNGILCCQTKHYTLQM